MFGWAWKKSQTTSLALRRRGDSEAERPSVVPLGGRSARAVARHVARHVRLGTCCGSARATHRSLGTCLAQVTHRLAQVTHVTANETKRTTRTMPMTAVALPSEVATHAYPTRPRISHTHSLLLREHSDWPSRTPKVSAALPALLFGRNDLPG